MHTKRSGFSMMEVMIGTVLFMFFVMAANSYVLTFMKTNVSIKDISQATNVGNTVMEKLRTISYQALLPDSQTVDQKYKCIWNVTENTASQIKVVDLAVKWSQFIAGRAKEHSVQLSTIIAK
jgi:Tfp pilus assembly protein PilV